MNKRDRKAYFHNLLQAVTRRLQEGWEPVQKVETKTLKQGITFALKAKSRQVNAKTLDSYKMCCRLLLNHFRPTKSLESITTAKLQKFFDDLNCSNSSKNNYLRSLKSVFQVLAEEQIIARNSFKKIKKYNASTTLHDVYSQEMMSKILHFIREQYPNLHLCCLLEYYCFLRPHYEIRLLKTGNINLRSRTILVHPETAKGGKARTIPIHASLIPIFEQRNLNQPYLFQIGDKPPCADYFKNQFKRLRKKINIPREYTLYGFKHTGVCALYRATKDIYLVSKLCGHSSIKTTEIYLRSLGQDTNYLDNSALPSII